MAYRITHRDRSLEKAVRRIAREQIDAALDELSTPGADPQEAVHQIRKHLKKLRGLLRLVRPGCADYARENAALRDLGRRLSGRRDTGALIETHDKLMIGAPDAARFDPLRARLVARADADTGTAPTPEDLETALKDLRARAATWALSGKDRALLRKGVEKTWARAAASYAAARANPGPAAIHEWRKRVKYNWYHARLLRDIRKSRMQPHRETMQRLGALLGDHHDLATYRACLDRAPPAGIAAETLADLDRRAAARQAELAQRAFALGAELFDDKPAKLPKRWARWWKAWRKR